MLPRHERRLFEQEQQHVALGPLGDPGRALGLFLHPLRVAARVDERVHVPLRREPLGRLLPLRFLVRIEIVPAALLAAFDVRRVDVDQVVEAAARVDELLDRLDAELVHVPADTAAVVRHLVHHLAIGLGEPRVLLEKIAVPVNVRHHQPLIDRHVRPHQVGVARVVVDDQLVDLPEAVVVLLGELVVLHPEPPVRVARRKAPLGGDLVKPIGVHELKDRRKEIKPIRERNPLDLHLNGGQVGRQRGKLVEGHFC